MVVLVVVTLEVAVAVVSGLARVHMVVHVVEDLVPVA